MAAIAAAVVDVQPKVRNFRHNEVYSGISDLELRERYQFGADGITFIHNLLKDSLEKKTNQINTVNSFEQVLLALRYYASGAFMQSIASFSTGSTSPPSMSCVFVIIKEDLLMLIPNGQDKHKEEIAQTALAPHKVFGRIVEVVDSPGLFDTELDNRSIHKELIKSLVLTTPGFHAIAYVLKRGERITEEHKKTQALFFDWFGPGVEHYTFVILTHCETVTDKNKYLGNNPQRMLTELIDKFGRRVVNIDNRGSGRSLETQVQCIFNTVDFIKATNRKHFTNVPFRLAEAYIRNKGSLELTKDSIIILNNAGLEMALSPAQSAVLEMVQGQDIDNENSHNTHSSSSGDTDEECDVYSHSAEEKLIRKIGNILKKDDSTEKQIHEEEIYSRKNRRKKEILDKMHKYASNTKCSPEHIHKELNLSSIIPEDSLEVANGVDFGSNELASDSYQETDPKKQYESEHKSKHREGRRNIAATEEEENDEFRQVGASEVGSQKPFKPIHSPRKGRQIDIESVRFTPQSDPINEYKEEINNDKGYEKLNRLIEYIKNAWDFCKRNIGCSIS